MPSYPPTPDPQTSAATRLLEQSATELRARLEATNRAREDALRQSREVIQFSSRAIRAIHRGETDTARALVGEARARVHAVRAMLAEHPDLFHAGYVHDSQKEYVEAEAMLAIAGDLSLPTPSLLGVEPAAYLNGMAEAASESRRFVLDKLRLGEVAQAERVLKVMDDIYYELVTFDFPRCHHGRPAPHDRQPARRAGTHPRRPNHDAFATTTGRSVTRLPYPSARKRAGRKRSVCVHTSWSFRGDGGSVDRRARLTAH